MFLEIIQAFFFIIMAEMGDKTQLLAMTFATKYSLGKVVMGVLLGSLLNHGLAALLGAYLTNVIPIDIVKIIAALAFVFFGIWSLNFDMDEEEVENKKFNFGPILTVGMAFFIGEFGDKTQLTVITLASQGSFPLFILMGTVTGMIITSLIGIVAGRLLGKRIPEIPLKIASATVFILFGIIGLTGNVPKEKLTNVNVSVFLVFLVAIVIWRLRNIMKKSAVLTAYKNTAELLYLNTKKIQDSLNKVYEKSKDCLDCSEYKCTISFLNNSLQEAQNNNKFVVEKEWEIPLCDINLCNKEILKESLIETIETCLECELHQKNCVGNQTRQVLEKLYFGKNLDFKGDKKNYYSQIEVLDKELFLEIINRKKPAHK
ncbi:putative Ca2+/H+ antiporter (TMEM165/GDT1 family) [Natranaerovirga pectinivora]|uniref:GDT1 family protein n=1 Tax=Natranaerovirga pectinivora TaxID=682400 RepID=A0A4R3MRV0_9FIRM|nr:TMEM165/GDT1 family protein [Natranaerovirga pectinivora]TCT16138.1 putative Ca2+/H+ antiporter (TMEM165/GDT1 family) [Natranaerovirga pectinivora]